MNIWQSLESIAIHLEILSDNMVQICDELPYVYKEIVYLWQISGFLCHTFIYGYKFYGKHPDFVPYTESITYNLW